MPTDVEDASEFSFWRAFHALHYLITEDVEFCMRGERGVHLTSIQEMNNGRNTLLRAVAWSHRHCQ